MNTTQVSDFILDLYRWYMGEELLSEIEARYGFQYFGLIGWMHKNELTNAFHAHSDGVSFQHILDCIILWIALFKANK